MISVNTTTKSVSIELNDSGCVEDFINILMTNNYWVRVKRDCVSKKIIVDIKESEDK